MRRCSNVGDERLPVVLCWHMHQPDYRDPLTGQSLAPWTYLHAIKDYADMAAHLEAQPHARAVVNFSATLLDQLEQYGRELCGLLDGSGVARDPLLAALYGVAVPQTLEGRQSLVRACLRANRVRIIDRFPRYKALVEMGEWALQHPEALDYLNDGFLGDLLVWYHLGWMGEWARRKDPLIQALLEQEQRFSLQQRHALVDSIARQVAGIIPRYKALAERGQVELSVTPYSHPILPLLLDFASAREAWPECPLPTGEVFPHGEARVRWQLAEARRCFLRHFQRPPAGCWPAEGGVSEAALGLIDEAGFTWAASGQAVLRNSLLPGDAGVAELHRPYRLAGRGPVCFFRDDELSDLIGFVYKDWHGDDAVANLLSRLEAIADAAEPGQVVSVVLDGENAWEHYPDNAFHFLSALYARLGEHPRLRLSHFSEVLEPPVTCAELSQLRAGSWVYGSFSTWIGEPDKNRAWELVVAAKQAYDRLRGGLDERRGAEADRRMAACECSDWFWWLGRDHDARIVSQFERMLRNQLIALYQVLGEEPPDNLAHPLAHGSAQGRADAMLRSQS